MASTYRDLCYSGASLVVVNLVLPTSHEECFFSLLAGGLNSLRSSMQGLLGLLHRNKKTESLLLIFFALSRLANGKEKDKSFLSAEAPQIRGFGKRKENAKKK